MRGRRVALVASLALAACQRSAPAPAATPRPPDEKQVRVVMAPAPVPLLTEQNLSPALRALVDAAHAHRAVGSLEAAGCDQALVMTGADYTRLVNLRSETEMLAPIARVREDVVWCQRRPLPPPDCAQLALIFVRVARPKGRFTVSSGFHAPPDDAPLCTGTYDRTGKVLHGEGPGYPSSRK